MAVAACNVLMKTALQKCLFITTFGHLCSTVLSAARMHEYTRISDARRTLCIGITVISDMLQRSAFDFEFGYKVRQ